MSDFDDLLRELEEDNNNTRYDHNIKKTDSDNNEHFQQQNNKQQKNNLLQNDPQFSIILDRNNRNSNMINDLLRELEFEAPSALQEKQNIQINNTNKKNKNIKESQIPYLNHISQNNTLNKTKLGDLSLYLKDLNITKDIENHNPNNTILNKQSILNHSTTKDFLLELERSKFIDNLHNNLHHSHNNNKEKEHNNNNNQNHNVNESQAYDLDLDMIIKEMNQELERKQHEIANKVQKKQNNNNNNKQNEEQQNNSEDKYDFFGSEFK